MIANYHQQLGPAHWQSGNAKVYLGMVLTNLRRYTEAGIVLEEARHVLTDSLGADHYRTQNAHKALADLAAARSGRRPASR